MFRQDFVSIQSSTLSKHPTHISAAQPHEKERQREEAERTLNIQCRILLHTNRVHTYQGKVSLPFAFFPQQEMYSSRRSCFCYACNTATKVNSIDISRSEGKSWYFLLSFLSFFPQKSAQKRKNQRITIQYQIVFESFLKSFQSHQSYRRL